MNASTARSPIGTQAAGHYRIDPARSSVRFTTRHLFGLGGVTGTFTLREAELAVGDPVTDLTFRAVIDAASFDTGNTKRDTDVVSRKYLDTATYPEITVTGHSASQRADTWVARCTVIAHGVAAPVEITLNEVTDTAGELTIHASARIDRYAHGITAGKGMAGRWLNLSITAVTTG
jgi:polyisoprenoid-binding protein YceI